MLDKAGMDALFHGARSQNGFLDRPVAPALLRELYDLVKMGPTSANCSPLRVIFLTSAEARQRLLPALSPGNVAKTTSAPVTCVLGYDTRFYEHARQLFPHNPQMYDGFAGNAAHAQTTAFRNATLQAGYFILAARALGLDCGPMSGFDESAVNASFFADGRFRVNFLCNLGYGDRAKLFGRLPRLPFDDACTLL
ncbi:MAG: malonic semialdehyde reductase [Proteobacteria bacterium]|nr:malonic semialdehyde reductase [Pseudomonadota bacterium]